MFRLNSVPLPTLSQRSAMAAIHSIAAQSFLSLPNPKPRKRIAAHPKPILTSKLPKNPTFPRNKQKGRRVLNSAVKREECDVIPVQSSDSTDQQEGVVASRVESEAGDQGELVSQVGGFGASEGRLSFEGAGGFGSTGVGSERESEEFERPVEKLLTNIPSRYSSASLNRSSASLNRSSFPSGFVFGSASASYQYEGAWNEGGKGPSIWDNFTHQYPGIAPYVTIFHWDLPQALEEEYGGFLNRQIVNHFRDYAELCFKLFGDRVKHWITLNEPYNFINFGYASGQLAPGRCSAWQNLNCTGGDSATEPYIVAHHFLLAHAHAVEVYKTKYQAASSWLVIYPKGIREILLYAKHKYNNPVIYITENGMDEFDDPKLSLPQSLNDTHRIDYHYHHLDYLRKAIDDGVNVKGYFAWSLTDNFEWAAGYTLRFGFVYIDYNDGLKRHPKLSASWFKYFLG
ncbi:hypothetical protein DVH24_038480 [Malus domestica]|uniref:Beta-glucosidase n=1 Tax=Malus domestica TaxID=3750 RepID=A0A498KA18_MALDO|nr:hypothetical protein DVH24_038480 [Malus domestica]